MTKTELFDIYRNLNKGFGLVLETKYENYLMINELTMVSKQGFMDFDSYNDDLLNKNGNSVFNIIGIYRCNLTSGFDSALKIFGENFIWKREEFVELTLDQIAEKFNIPVSQLKIKK